MVGVERLIVSGKSGKNGKSGKGGKGNGLIIKISMFVCMNRIIAPAAREFREWNGINGALRVDRLYWRRNPCVHVMVVLTKYMHCFCHQHQHWLHSALRYQDVRPLHETAKMSQDKLPFCDSEIPEYKNYTFFIPTVPYYWFLPKINTNSTLTPNSNTPQKYHNGGPYFQVLNLKLSFFCPFF